MTAGLPAPLAQLAGEPGADEHQENMQKQRGGCTHGGLTVLGEQKKRRPEQSPPAARIRGERPPRHVCTFGQELYQPFRVLDNDPRRAGVSTARSPIVQSTL